jgi:hypothetical protein
LMSGAAERVLPGVFTIYVEKVLVPELRLRGPAQPQGSTGLMVGVEIPPVAATEALCRAHHVPTS